MNTKVQIKDFENLSKQEVIEKYSRLSESDRERIKRNIDARVRRANRGSINGVSWKRDNSGILTLRKSSDWGGEYVWLPGYPSIHPWVDIWGDWMLDEDEDEDEDED